MLLKSALALAPLAWGMIAWFFITGPGQIFPYRIIALTSLLLISAMLYRTLEYARGHYIFKCFEHFIPLPPWAFLVSITLVGLISAVFFPNILFGNPILASLIMGVTVSATLEELIARPLFIAFEMGSTQAILFNLISSFAFSFMHSGYEAIPATAYEYIFVRGHFLFSFTLGLIAYKTRRIEVCIILHMLSNFLRYTFPVLILGQPSNPPLSLTLDVITLTILAGGGYTYYKTRRSNAKPKEAQPGIHKPTPD